MVESVSPGDSKANKTNEYKSLKKIRVNIMNLQLVPGSEIQDSAKEAK